MAATEARKRSFRERYQREKFRINARNRRRYAFEPAKRAAARRCRDQHMQRHPDSPAAKFLRGDFERHHAFFERGLLDPEFDDWLVG